MRVCLCVIVSVQRNVKGPHSSRVIYTCMYISNEISFN